jgi:hypothetical protein
MKKCSHSWGCLPTTLIELPVMIREAGLVPARFGVADDGEILHQENEARFVALSGMGVNEGDSMCKNPEIKAVFAALHLAGTFISL